VEQAARRTSASILLKQTLFVHQWLLSVVSRTNFICHCHDY
jgi:hypothetical protein